MNDVSKKLLVIITTLLLFGTAVSTVGAATTSVETTDGIELTIEPTDETIDAGESQAYDIILTGADEITALEFALELSDTDVANFESFDLAVDPEFEDITVSDSELEVSVGSGLEPFDGSGEFTVGTLIVEGNTEGDANISIVDGTDGVSVSDGDGSSYPVTDVSGATISVEGTITDPAIEITPENSEIDVEEDAALTIGADVISNGVSEYTITASFDENVVSLSESDIQTPIASDADISVADGEITIDATADSQESIEAAELVILEFQGIAEGESTVDIESVTITDTDGSEYQPRSITTADITVLPVDSDTGIDFRLDRSTVDAGDDVTGDLVVTGATNGISAYDLQLTSADADVAEITDVELKGNPQFPDSSVAADGSSAEINAGMGDNVHSPASEITIATVTISGVSEGETDLDIAADGVIQDLDDIEYDIDRTSGDSLSVSGEITDPVVEVTPSTTDITIGETTELAVAASDLVSGLSTVSYTVSVDETVVDLDEVSVPDATDVSVSGDNGEIIVDATYDEPLTSDQTEIGLLSFSGVDVGESDVTLESIELIDENGNEYTPREVSSGTIQVFAEDDVEVEFRTEESEVTAGDSLTGDVVVVNARDGISAYDLNISTEDSEIAEFSSIELTNNPQFPDSSVSSDGSVATVSAGMGADTHTGASEITIATVTIDGVSEGTADFAFDSDIQIADSDDNMYTIESTRADSVTVTGEITDPTVGIEPTEAETDVDESTEVTVEAADLVSGLSSVSYTISVDEDVVEPGDVSIPEASDTDTTISGGDIVVDATFDDEITDQSATLGLLELSGVAVGESNITISSITLVDDAGIEYEPRSVTNGLISVGSADRGITVEVVFPTEEVSEQTSVTGDIVVRNAGSGIGAYDMNISLSDSNIATISSLEPTNNPLFDNSQINTETSATLVAGMGDNVHDPGDVVIAHLTVDAVGTGTVNVDIDDPAVSDRDVVGYEILGTESAQLAVTETVSLFEITPLSDLQFTTSQADGVTIETEISNVGDDAGTEDVKLYIDDELLATSSVELDVNESTTVSFTDVETPTEPGTYTYKIETPDETRTANLTIVEGPEPIIGSTPPQDLSGDGLFEDINGDGQFDIFDVQALHTNIDSDTVQDNAEFFNFSGQTPDRVDIFDVQTLFQMTE